MNKKSQLMALAALSFSSLSFANPAHFFYGAVDGGIFSSAYDQNYSYLAPSVPNPQNVTAQAFQRGYTGGLAIGFRSMMHKNYFLGAQISGNWDSDRANYQAGASGPFSDKTWINGHMDFSVVPGINLFDVVSLYVKLGLSVAFMQDQLGSFAGNFVTPLSVSTTKSLWGFAGGLGFSRAVSQHIDVFTEADYHDYGNNTFPQFLVQSATYGHSAHLYSYDVLLGAAYRFV